MSGCERGEAEDQTQGVGGGVSILTAHKAKGLEASVVIVGDANFSEIESGGRGDSADILIDWPPESPAPDSFVVRPRSLPLAWRALAKQDECAKLREDDNILYVAMTRAKRALFLFAPGEKERGPAARFNLFEKLAALPGAEGDASGGRGRRFIRRPHHGGKGRGGGCGGGCCVRGVNSVGEGVGSDGGAD